jgi:zinc/manganese transport system permease protein
LTVRPALGLAVSVAIGVAITWVGLFVAYFTPYPIGFYLTTMAFLCYASVGVLTMWSASRMSGGWAR